MKAGNTLIDNIKNLRQLLPERYRYGKNGKGGITAELNKIGINLDRNDMYHTKQGTNYENSRQKIKRNSGRYK